MPVRVDRAGAIERALASVYLRIFTEIKKQDEWPDGNFRKEFENKVHDATRRATQEIYQEGMDYVANKLKLESFFTVNDIENIKKQTDSAVESFWTRIAADAERTRVITTEEKIGAGSAPFNTEAWLEDTATVLTTSSLAEGTLNKVQQTADSVETKPMIVWNSQRDERTCTILPNGKEGCALLDGQSWPYDDITIPVPGRLGESGTHPNCRCWLSLE